MRTMISDQLLVDLLANKDRSAFRFLQDSYSPSLHGSVVDLMADKDIVEHVFKKALAAAYFTIRHHKRGRKKMYTWMLHFALRLVLEPLRSIYQWPTAKQLQEASCALHAILNAMEPVSKNVIRLIYERGYNKVQVACLLNVPVYRVEELLQDGLRPLQDYINKCCWDDCYKTAC